MLAGGRTEGDELLLCLALTGGEVLYNLVLADADLGQTLQDFVHF